jgi:ABC-type transport system involved in multi-copper enzyme maturation permease subunit
MNPIISRELLEVLRTRKALAAQVSLAVLCAVLVLLRWPTGEVTDNDGVRSLAVLRVFGYGLLAGILLLAPAFPATALVREKVQGTLALLLNSPMRPWSIYAGKLGGVLGFTVVLLIMTLPAAAACYALGGTTTSGGIVDLYLVLAVAALQISTLGLLVSSRARSTDGALRITYALVLVLAIAPVLPLSPLPRFLSPVAAVMEILGQRDVGALGMTRGGGQAFLYIVVALLSSVGFALATVARLNHRLLDQARPSGVMTQDRSQEGQVFRRMLFLIDPQRRSGSMSLWINPVLVKEFRARRFGRSHWMIRLVAISAIISLALSCVAAMGAVPWGIEYIAFTLVLLQVALLILFSPSLAAGLVSSERESGSWQLLRMTPLSAGVILRGKLLSVVWPLLLLLCATLPGYIVLMTLEPAFIHRAQRVVACLCLTAVFGVLLSAACSTLFRSTAAATTASYLLLLAICGGPLLIWLGEEAPFGHGTVEAALTISPVAAALQASGWDKFASYELLPANWWIIGSTCLALLVFLCVRVWRLCRPE